MKLRNAVLTLILCVAWATVPQVRAQSQKLAEGNTAPGLDIDKWLKGSETTIESGKTYIIEFWAPKVEACQRALPILTSMQREWRDDGLVVIGITGEVYLTDEGGGNQTKIEMDDIKAFIRRQGEQMDFTVAYDRQNSTIRAWMDAAEKKKVPTAFIVDKQGKIAYIGDPLEEKFRNILRRVLTGRYDPNLEHQAEPVLKEARTARKEHNWRVALKRYEDVVELDKRVFAGIALEKFDTMLASMGDRALAYDYAVNTLIAKHFVNDPEALRMLAEKITTDPAIDVKLRDYDVALAAAQAAQKQATPATMHAALSTLALVHFHRGDVQEAIELQKQAYFQAPPKYKDAYRRALNSYQESATRNSKATTRPAQ
jgi:thiol-disulfide isomerase/thioredoxin